MDNYFTALNDINVNGKIEKKNGLSYLSWAWAWGEVKKNHPDATYTIYEDEHGCFYHNDGKTAWVKTGVTINGIEHIEYLPVMDNRNRSIALEHITSFDANKAIQRSLTKAIARHGLGLYIYAGEDLPESDTGIIMDAQPKSESAAQPEKTLRCDTCFSAFTIPESMTLAAYKTKCISAYNKVLCPDCGKKAKAAKALADVDHQG